MSDEYLRALDDFEDRLDNAASNHADPTTAPWHWDFELRDQIIMLREQHEEGKDDEPSPTR